MKRKRKRKKKKKIEIKRKKECGNVLRWYKRKYWGDNIICETFTKLQFGITSGTLSHTIRNDAFDIYSNNIFKWDLAFALVSYDVCIDASLLCQTKYEMKFSEENEKYYQGNKQKWRVRKLVALGVTKEINTVNRNIRSGSHTFSKIKWQISIMFFRMEKENTHTHTERLHIETVEAQTFRVWDVDICFEIHCHCHFCRLYDEHKTHKQSKFTHLRTKKKRRRKNNINK